MGKNIYLAGKITKNGWRHEIVSGLDCMNFREFYGYETPLSVVWPTMEKSIFGEYHYVGPYFVACDHGCFHGQGTHGWSGEDGYCGSASRDPLTSHHGRSFVITLCNRAIAKADFVFAWIDSLDAYGTFAEIGYARAHGKVVVIASPVYLPDLWFIYGLGSWTLFDYDNPKDALRRSFSSWRGYLYSDMLESPIEKSFWQAGGGEIDGIVPQLHVGRYRVDFAIPQKNVVIELDGHQYHKTREQRTSDAKRERFLEGEGWRVIRFTGTEIHKNVEKCVAEVNKFVASIG